jgi:sulfite dehydrogenase (cytochrome) subunit B
MTMKRFILVAVLALATTGVTLAKSLTYTLPPEASTLKKTDDPGYPQADSLCVACHSRDYITTQPRGKGRDFWTAEVTKMVNVYGAKIPEASRPPIIDYLAANY